MHVEENDKSFSLDKIEIKRLPFLLQELITLIGLKQTYCLLQEYGGQSKYIPKQADKSKLSQLLSSESLALLCAEFGGLTIDIPMSIHIERQVRNRAIAIHLDLGRSRSEIAKSFNICVRQVANIKRSLEADNYHEW